VLLALAVLASAACGSGGSTSAAGPGRAAGADGRRSEACLTGDVAGCVAAVRTGCQPGAAHRLRFSGVPPLAVGPGGLIRLDHLGGQLLGTDGSQWLACFEDCPGGGGERICFPLSLPLEVSWSPASGCQRKTRPAPPWHGRPSEVVALTCPDGVSELRHVPELSPVRRELVRAGVIDERDALAGLEGLVVEMGAGGAVESALEELEPVSCEEFAPPAGYRVMAGAEARRRLEASAAEDTRRLSSEVEAVRTAMAVEAVWRAKAELMPGFRQQFGEECRAAGHDPDLDAELEACVAAREETEAPFRAAVARETRRLVGERREELDAMTREVLVGPMCRRAAAEG
jgi:hypothetical protein